MGADAVDLPTLIRFARISERTAKDLASRGIFERVGRGRYALEASIGNYFDHLREVAAGRGSDDEGADLVKERALLAREQREGCRLRNEQTKGNLVPVDEVRGRWRSILATVRAGMLAVPGRVRQALPHLTATDALALDREIRTALDELSRDEQP